MPSLFWSCIKYILKANLQTIRYRTGRPYDCVCGADRSAN